MLQHLIKTLKRNAYLIATIVVIAAGFNLSGGFAHVSHAATTCPSNLSSVSGLGLPAYCNVVGSDSTGLLTHVINLLLALLGIIAVLFIIIGGYKMVTSNGQEKAFESGQKTVTYAVIGLVVAVLAFTIITVIGNTLGSATGGSTSGTNSPATSTTNGTSGTASTGTPDCSTLTDAQGIEAETADANKQSSTTFSQNDVVYLISKASNPEVQQCTSSVSVIASSSSDGRSYNLKDNDPTFSTTASELVSGGTGTTIITWTYTNKLTNTVIGRQSSGTITVTPTGGS